MAAAPTTGRSAGTPGKLVRAVKRNAARRILPSPPQPKARAHGFTRSRRGAVARLASPPRPNSHARPGMRKKNAGACHVLNQRARANEEMEIAPIQTVNRFLERARL